MYAALPQRTGLAARATVVEVGVGIDAEAVAECVGAEAGARGVDAGFARRADDIAATTVAAVIARIYAAATTGQLAAAEHGTHAIFTACEVRAGVPTCSAVGAVGVEVDAGVVTDGLFGCAGCLAHAVGAQAWDVTVVVAFATV